MARQCAVTGCDKKVLSRGLCNRHYRQWQKYGRILQRTYRDPNDVVKYEDCWGIVLRDRNYKKVGEAVIDAADYDLVKKYKWNLDSSGYARTVINTSCGKKSKRMHHCILPNTSGIDHKNRNRLDNRKINLRECTYAQNVMNKSLHVNNTSGVPGVSWNKKSKKWLAQIGKDQKWVTLGYYENLDAAKEARKQAEQEYFGEFAPS